MYCNLDNPPLGECSISSSGYVLVTKTSSKDLILALISNGKISKEIEKYIVNIMKKVSLNIQIIN